MTLKERLLGGNHFQGKKDNHNNNISSKHSSHRNSWKASTTQWPQCNNNGLMKHKLRTEKVLRDRASADSNKLAKEEEMCHEIMRYEKVLEEAATQRAKELKKGKVREEENETDDAETEDEGDEW
ncbi:hypothetical protein PIB30_073630 [Stylosanthes scabra]|uniref:Uncharacterized protein n=1 Tax=Stylosanthes scabra TaxID=79078 RepID=A0ABU6XMC5_9FABA|nr:hypothetical protein [Stylosanthes scabra]